jgi:hypothetical protein
MKISKQYLKQIIKEEMKYLIEMDAFSSVPDSPFMVKSKSDEETKEFTPDQKKQMQKMISDFGGLVKIKNDDFQFIMNKLQEVIELSYDSDSVVEITNEIQKKLQNIKDGLREQKYGGK